MLRRVLRLEGYEVVTFASGEGFLAITALSKAPDCVILDVHMTGLSGLEVQSRLVAMSAGLATIFITASDERQLENAVEQAGGFILLRKPFASEALLDALRAVLHDSPPLNQSLVSAPNSIGCETAKHRGVNDDAPC